MKRKYLKISLLVFIVFSFISLGYYYIDKSTEYRQIAGVKYYNTEDISNLAVLCKVWGYLKYYHPSVVEGKFNWDDELVKMMPAVLKATSKDERNNILSEWVTSLGGFKQDTFPEISKDSVKMYPDLDWLKDKKELGLLSHQLEEIKTAKRDSDKTNYLEFPPNDLGTFRGEKAYNETTYPSTEFRLLGLFRFWNVIQYYYPYKYLIGENWHNVLQDFIPKFINAKNELEYKLDLLELLTKLNDTHASIGYERAIEKWKGGNIAPYEVSFIQGKLVVTAIYEVVILNNANHSLQVGDVISSINKTSVDDYIKEKIKYAPGSNYAAQLLEITRFILRTNEELLDVEYIHKGKCLQSKLFCYNMGKVKITSKFDRNEVLYKIIRDSIGYLYLGSTQGGEVPQNIQAKGLIIDLRCYPSYEKITGYFNYMQLYSKPKAFVKFTLGDSHLPGLFRFLGTTRVGRKNSNAYKGKKIILVNEITRSHAEFMAMKYRVAENSIIIGSTTAGADGGVFNLKMPGGITTSFTGAGVYYPDGRETQRVGIVSDIVVKPTIKGIQEGKDEVLEKAIKLITKKPDKLNNYK